MKELVKYLNDTLGTETKIVPPGKRLLQQLPLYITSSYNVRETTLYGQRICLLIPKNTEDVLPPDRLSRQMSFVGQKTGLPVVFMFDNIVSYNIKRLIQKGVNFIIPGKQMFIPALMMDLRKTPASVDRKPERLAPVAQFVLLYHLQKERLNGFTAQQLTEKFNQSYRTISRAIKNIEELELCGTYGGREKRIKFQAKGAELWNQAHEALQNPVERILFTDDRLNNGTALASNINALAHYSMLNDETKRHYAVGKSEAKNLETETNKHAGENTVEIWRYNPYPLSNCGIVDKLSLYLLLENDDDERVQGELEQMINQMQWSEE